MLYAIDLSTGADKTPPVELAPAAPIPFGPSDHLQRSALFSTAASSTPPSPRTPITSRITAGSWPTTRRRWRPSPPTSTPPGHRRRHLDGRPGPAVDEDGQLFLSTGNGTFDAASGGPNFGDSVLALSLSSSALVVRDSFTPYNQEELQARDSDLGSMGPLVIPGSHQLRGRDHRLVLVGGKEGKAYLLDRDDFRRLSRRRRPLAADALADDQLRHGRPRLVRRRYAATALHLAARRADRVLDARRLPRRLLSDGGGSRHRPDDERPAGRLPLAQRRRQPRCRRLGQPPMGRR